jgi:GTP:adenosylcobinamide-phosphate guanylyltransferase
MDAIILAGGKIAQGNPLYKIAESGIKVMIEIAGKPMIQWIIDALNQSDHIDRIFISGLNGDSHLVSEKRIFYLEGGKNLMDSILIGMYKLLESNPNAEKCLVVSGDIPTINSKIVDWVINSATDPGVEIFYNVVPMSVMERRFPESKRSYVKLRDKTVCGGDMHVFNPQSTIRDGSKWRHIVESRKSLHKLMFLFGFEILFRAIFMRPTLVRVADLVCNKLEMSGRVVESPYAELGMDVDNLHQFQLVEKELRNLFLTN